jgi:hypothetical protein
MVNMIACSFLPADIETNYVMWRFYAPLKFLKPPPPDLAQNVSSIKIPDTDFWFLETVITEGWGRNELR